jgi:Protein of unknown function (DUF4232)
MDRATRSRSLIVTAAIACAAVMVPAVALAASSAPAAPAAPRSQAKPATTPRCPASSIEVWLGLNPDGGAAGTTFYPLEFTDTGFGPHTCYLSGHAAIYAINSKGQRIGPALSASTAGHKITLKPGQTAYTRIGIVDAGIISGCGQATAAGLEVTPPGQTQRQPIDSFTFPVCKHKRYMNESNLTAGVGIP